MKPFTPQKSEKSEQALIVNLLTAVEVAVSLGVIEKKLDFSMNKKTLQRRLKKLVEEGIVVKVGEKRNTQYTLNKDNLPRESINIATNKDNSVSIARADDINEDTRQGLTGEAIEIYLKTFCLQRTIEFSDKFIIMTKGELKHLHSGAIIGLGITEKTFKAWKESQ